MSKIFGTDGIRCLVNEEPLTAETCLKISKSVSFILRKKNNQSSRVVICKDTRLSGYLYEPNFKSSVFLLVMLNAQISIPS